MRRQIAKRTKSGGLFKTMPVDRCKRIGHVVFVVGAVEMDHLTNFSALNDLFRQLRRWVLHIVEPHQRFHSRPLCSFNHFTCVVGIQRQRLF